MNKKAVVFFEYLGENVEIDNITFVKEYQNKGELYSWIAAQLKKWMTYNHTKYGEEMKERNYDAHVSYVDDRLIWDDQQLECDICAQN